MAKKQLKKINQPKKYLQGGSNMGSVSMMRQNPYYVGQVNQDAAEEDLANMQEQVMQNKQFAAQSKRSARDVQNQQLDETIRNNTSNLIKAAATDQKAGRLGSLFTRGPLSGQAAMNISAGTQIAPIYAAPATTTVASNVGSLAPGAVEVGANLANTSTNVVSGVNAATAGVPAAVAPTGEFVTQGIASGAKGAAGLSSLATAGIGAAATIGGQVIKKRSNDNSDYTFTDKERRGNIGGSALSSAGTGFSTGAMIGSFVPGIGNVVGGAIGAGIGAGIGALKARKENKAAEEEAQRLQREQAAMRGAFQGAFVNSHLTSGDMGFGLNSSTNMNNQFTNQYQVAKTGGVTGIQEDRRTKKVPGGKIVPIEGTDAVEFIGRSHEKGGVTIDKNTEVEGGETMDQVAMNNNGKQDYIFSKYLKLGGKSFAQRHKEILKGSGSQAEIQQLAAMQEKVAGRNPQQVAAYGGFHKYAMGGAPCPDGYEMDASGNCVPIVESSGEQNAASNDPTRKQVSQADYDFYIREKNARLANEQRQAAAQNGTSNAPAAATATPTATVNPGVQPPATTQPVTPTTPAAPNNVDPKGNKLPDGYVWDATLNAPVSVAATSASTNVKGANAPNAAPTGVTPPSATNPPAATTNTGGSNAPLTDAEMFAPAAKRATSTGTTAGTPQTPEEKEAARLAGLPRLFMGASRKVDENTGEVTTFTDKPLMGVGAMAGSRLGTATGSQEDLAKVTNNSYDQAWQNKADNLYTNQKDASGGGLSSSDAIRDRDKIAESNWGQKYGYKKGMSADEAKAAHGKFAEDVHSLFTNNPDEMLGYFQYIIDGGDPTKTDSYLGKDAEQIRNNLKTKGYIDANGQPVAGKKVDGQTMAQYLERQATNNAVGPIHNALGSYTAERSATKIKLKEGEKKKDEVVTQELPKKYEPCPPGTYRSGDGSCKPVGDIPQGNRISGALMAGLGQLIPVGAALANPYKIAQGIMGAPAIKGALMPRVNMNQERAENIQQNVAYKNAVINQNAGPGALAAMQMANTKTNEQMLKIAQQEQNQNRQLAAEEGKLGMQASMFNAENNLKTQMFNKEFNQKERQYRREDILGALDTAAARVAGIIKDDRSYKAQERLATALDETGSYDRFSILEQLNKDAKRKGSPYYGTTETERRRIAAAMHKELNPEGYIGMSEYNKLQEEKAKLQKEKEELEKAGKAKFGGARQYVSRLGELKGVRGTKANI